MHKSKSSTNKNEIKFGPDPQWAYCPYCSQGIQTQVKYNATASTHIIASILCALGCWLCFWIPYVLKNFNIARHYCPICVHYIGSYNPRTKIAASTVDHRYHTTIAAPAFIRHTHAHRKKNKIKPKNKKRGSISPKVSGQSKILNPLPMPIIPIKRLKSQSQQTKDERGAQKIYRDVSICTHMYKNIGTESRTSRPKKCTSLSFGQYTQTCSEHFRKMSEKKLATTPSQNYEARVRSRLDFFLSKLISSEKFLRACTLGSTQVVNIPKKAIEQTEKATSTMNCFSNYFQPQNIASECLLKPNRRYRSKSDYFKFSEIVDSNQNKNEIRRRPKSKITITMPDAEPKQSDKKLQNQTQTIDIQTESKIFDCKPNFETTYNTAELAVVLKKAFQNELRFQKRMALPKKDNNCYEKVQTEFSSKLPTKALSKKNNNTGCDSSLVSSDYGVSEQEQDVSDGICKKQHLDGGASKALQEPNVEVLASFDKKFRKPSRLRKPNHYCTSVWST